MTEENKNEFPVARSFYCHHCGTKAQFNLIFPNMSHKDEKESKNQFKLSVYKYNYNDYSYKIWSCQVCQKLVFRAVKMYNGGRHDLIGQFPSAIRVNTNFIKIVPNNILEDFASALKCFEFGEYRASVALCRRSLQSSVLEQLADPNKKLMEQINELNQENPNRFTNDIKDWAHNIRVFGNWGAHPDNDGLKDIKEPTAKEIIEFMKSYFQYVYVMPERVEKARIMKKSKTKPKNSS